MHPLAHSQVLPLQMHKLLVQAYLFFLASFQLEIGRFDHFSENLYLRRFLLHECIELLFVLFPALFKSRLQDPLLVCELLIPAD